MPRRYVLLAFDDVVQDGTYPPLGHNAEVFLHRFHEYEYVREEIGAGIGGAIEVPEDVVAIFGLDSKFEDVVSHEGT